MVKYWLKIGLGASLIFLVGFGIISAGRHARHSIVSNKDLTIPLGGFIPFKLDGVEAGKLSSLVIHRSAPKNITGFDVNARVADSATFEKLRECRLSITDAAHFDERTTFTCLASDSGFTPFGEVRLTLRVAGGSHTLVQPLLLPESAVRDIQRHAADSVALPVAESLASSLKASVRIQERAREDSAAIARLERRAKDMQRRADSIRNSSHPIPPLPAPKP
jgi:hypothetical protein